MNRARAMDWLIGAVAMFFFLLAVVAMLAWASSDPAGETAAGSRPPPPEGDEGRSGVGSPPPGLREDQVWLPRAELSAATLVRSGSTLRDVRAVGRGVVTSPEGLEAAELTVDATVPFETVAAEVGEGTVVGAAEAGQARVSRTVEGLGRVLRVTATGTVEVLDGRLVMEPRSVDIGAPALISDATATVVRQLVTIEHEVEGLPDGLELQHVDVRPDGFRAHLRGEDVTLDR